MNKFLTPQEIEEKGLEQGYVLAFGREGRKMKLFAYAEDKVTHERNKLNIPNDHYVTLTLMLRLSRRAGQDILFNPGTREFYMIPQCTPSTQISKTPEPCH